MPFASSYSTDPDPGRAAEQAAASIAESLDGATVDLVIAFVSAHHAEHDAIPRIVHERLQPGALIGCTAETVICGDQELENTPAVGLWAASVVDAPIVPFHVTFERTPDGLLTSGMPRAETTPFVPTAAILVGDPFTTSVSSIVDGLGAEFESLPLYGGMASAGRRAGENRLYRDDTCLERGAVGVLLGPGYGIRSVVSQGCRPVGEPFVITKSEQNIVAELGGRPAMARLQEVFDAASERDQALLQRGPHLGLAMNELQDSWGRGDFLIANVVGGDRESGALAVGNAVRTGQTAQFHVRDASAADEDLRSLIDDAVSTDRPEAALLFSCNGRGTRMFPRPHHDAATVREMCGAIPLAGLFAQGELGPVGGRNHMHGFTASLVLFRDESSRQHEDG